MSGVMTAIGIGWGITWFTYAADYSRFVSRAMPRRKLYLASTLGQFIPVVWLGILGATLATKNGTVDPGPLIVDNFGALAIPVLLLVSTARSPPTSSTSTPSRWPPRRSTSRSTGARSASSSVSSRWLR